MRVTILDTPQPGPEILTELPPAAAVDFYVSTGFVNAVSEEDPPESMFVKRLDSYHPANMTTSAHSKAYKWYTGTIVDAKPDTAGFGLSPFARKR